MNNCWWRNPRSAALKSEDRTSWPDLHSNARSTALTIRSIGQSPASTSEKHAWGGNLDRQEYPNLGERSPKRKHVYEQSRQHTLEQVEAEDSKLLDDTALPRKIYKKPKSSDLICIDLQEALESQKLLKEPQVIDVSKRAMNFRELNVNISLKPPKHKRLSKMKAKILAVREFETQFNLWKREQFEIEKMKAMTKGASEIEFDKLKITADPSIDVDYVGSMRTLKLFDNDHRRVKADDVPEHTVQSRPDLTKKLDDMIIEDAGEQFDGNSTAGENSSVTSQGDLSLAIIDKTLSLKICNETGETIEFSTNPEGDSQLRHSKKFREYCTNVLTSNLNKYLDVFLTEVVRLQRKLYDKDNVKGRYKRRYYAGLKEIEKHVESKKIKFVVIAPDLEKVEVEGGLDESVQKLIVNCRRHEVVYCFGLARRKLGYITHRKGLVSCIGIANYSNAEEKFEDVLKELMTARNEYRRLNGESVRINDLTKLIPESDLLLSENIKVLMRILASTC